MACPLSDSNFFPRRNCAKRSCRTTETFHCANISASCWRSRQNESRNNQTKIGANASRRNASSPNLSRAIPITFCGRSTNSMQRAGLRWSWTNPGCARSRSALKGSCMIADLNLSTKRTVTHSPRSPSRHRASKTCWWSGSTAHTGRSGRCCAPPSPLHRGPP